MNKKMIACLTALVGMVAISSAEPREFEDKFGRIINAELVSHVGKTTDSVKIKTKGKVHDIKIDKFSEKDQKYIRAWMAKTPPKINYSFKVEADKKKQSSVKQRGYYYGSSKSDMYVFEVKVTNTSTQVVSDLKIKYQAVMEDKVGSSSIGIDIDGSSSSPYYSSRYGRGLKVIEDTIKVKGPLKYGQSATFVTKPFRIDTNRYSYYYSNSRMKDSILGCRVRVMDSTGTVQEDYRTKNTKFAKINLDGNEDKTEVIVE